MFQTSITKLIFECLGKRLDFLSLNCSLTAPVFSFVPSRSPFPPHGEQKRRARWTLRKNGIPGHHSGTAGPTLSHWNAGREIASVQITPTNDGRSARIQLPLSLKSSLTFGHLTLFFAQLTGRKEAVSEL